MNTKLFAFLPFMILMSACAAPDSEDAAASESAIVQPACGDCASTFVRRARFEKLDPPLSLEVDEALGAVGALRGSGFVVFSEPKTAAEIAELGVEPRSVLGDTATVGFSLGDVLRLSSHPHVVAIHAEGVLAPEQVSDGSDSTSAPAPTATPQASIRDAVLSADLTKLDPPLLAAVEEALAAGLSGQFRGLLLVDQERTSDEIKAFGLEPTSVIGDVATVTFSLAGALRATAHAEVLRIELSGPLFTEPGTGEPGGTRVDLARLRFATFRVQNLPRVAIRSLGADLGAVAPVKALGRE